MTALLLWVMGGLALYALIGLVFAVIAERRSVVQEFDRIELATVAAFWPLMLLALGLIAALEVVARVTQRFGGKR